MYTVNMFLGPREPYGIPLSVSPLIRKQNLDQLYTGIYVSQSSEDSSN